MNPEALGTELNKEPFHPIRLRLSDGRAVTVDNPDVAIISNLALYLFKVRRENRKMADDTQVISLRHIVSFEPVEPKGRGRKARPAG